MWLAFACLAAVAAGLTAILAKIGMAGVDSYLATALRTIVVLAFAWLIVLITGVNTSGLDAHSMAFLVLSGLATGASWVCYFRALQVGDVNKVAVVDRMSTVLAMLGAIVFLGEPMTLAAVVAMVAIGIGSYAMVSPGRGEPSLGNTGQRGWLAWASGSAVFAALTSILGKVGVTGVEPNLATAIRTSVVLVAAWALVFALGRHKGIGRLTRRNWVFLVLSGITTGVSWLAFYRALAQGPASVVVPIDKLSILLTVGFAVIVLKERLSRRAWWGLAVLTAGTLVMVVAGG